MAENAERNLRLFQELITCAQELYFHTFDAHMKCVHTTSPGESLYQSMFSMNESETDFQDMIRKADCPVVLTSSLGYLWIAEAERDASGDLLYIHVIGPAFIEDVSIHSIEESLERLGRSSILTMEFRNVLKDIPVVPISRYFEYAQMMHYCITGQKITVSDLQYCQAKAASPQQKEEEIEKTHGTWAMEQKMMQMVSEGNLNFRQEAGRIASTGVVGNLGHGSSLRHIKNMIIISTTLFTRAAIRGGLNPEIAFMLSDRYINAVEGCKSFAEISEVNSAMQDDFVQRVHRIKASDGMSPQIRKCCDYIQLNVEKKLTIAELAQVCGYSETHLSRRFKQETGQTISRYILGQKIEMAKALLLDDAVTVQEIAARLGFESQSYFGEQFRRAVGMTPGEYRSKGSTEK